jgi:hypothetical protein
LLSKNDIIKTECENGKIDAISIFDIDGNILVTHPTLRKRKKLFSILKTNFKKPKSEGQLISLEVNCHKLWFKRMSGLVFSLATKKDVPEKVSRHVFNLIIKPFFQGFKENLKNYKLLKKNFQFFTEILQSCCYEPFIEVLIKELGN